MVCIKCSSQNEDTHVFCCKCGSPLQYATYIDLEVKKQVELALLDRVKDQKLAAVEIFDVVKDRLLDWAKLFGIALSIALASLTFVGIHKIEDVQGVATRTLNKRITSELDPKIEKSEKQIADELAEYRKQLEAGLELSTKDRLSLGQDLNQRVAAIEAKLKISQPDDVASISVEPSPPHFEPLPPPTGVQPFRLALGDVIGARRLQQIVDAGSISFQVTGATGGVKNPEPQLLVAAAMERQLASAVPAERPAFLYLLGNIVFYNGEVAHYYDQFYKPYADYSDPIFAIPGNHDAEPADSNAKSLDGFSRNFMAARPGTRTPESQNSGRAAMQEPNTDWTLITPFATIIGLYTNVPENGVVTPAQKAWLVAEMRAADKTKALIVAMNHPPFSFDTYHSGSSAMANVLSDAINASRRLPNMVLAAHVHNYQRMEVTVVGHVVPFFVIGTGGYFNLHHLGAQVGYVETEGDRIVQLTAAEDSRHGFMTFEIDHKWIKGRFTTVPHPGEAWTDPSAYDPNFDSCRYDAGPLFLEANESVNLARGTSTVPRTPH